MISLIIIIGICYAIYRTNTENSGFSDPIDRSSALINLKIRDIDITGIRQVILYPSNSPSFVLKTRNSVKLIKAVIFEMKKTEFFPGELQSIYEYILKNYESSLPKTTFLEITNQLGIFVRNGGRAVLDYGTEYNKKETSLFVKILKIIGWIITIGFTLGIIAVVGVVLFCVVVLFGGAFF